MDGCGEGRVVGEAGNKERDEEAGQDGNEKKGG